MEKQITKEQLVEFAKRIYQQGCFGHFDLMESYCEAVSSEFFGGLQGIVGNEKMHKLEMFPALNLNAVSVSQEMLVFDSHVTITDSTTNHQR